MSEPTDREPEDEDAPAGEECPAPAPRPARHRRPPEQTSDDTDRGWGERPDEDGHDQWLLEQRPPHWD